MICVANAVFSCFTPIFSKTTFITDLSKFLKYTTPITSNSSAKSPNIHFIIFFLGFFLFLFTGFLCCIGLFSSTSFFPCNSLFSVRICLSIASDPLRPDSLFSLSASQFGHNPVVSSSLVPHFPQNFAMFLLPCFGFYSIFSSLFVSSISLKILSESKPSLLNQYSVFS